MAAQDFPSELFVPFLQDNNDIPRYMALFRAFQQSILNGDLVAGAKLPASRTLSANLGVSRNTVKTAYEILLSEGYIETRHGSGSYVSSHLPEQKPDAQEQLDPSSRSPATLKLSELAIRLTQQSETPPAQDKNLLLTTRPDTVHYPWKQWQQCVLAANRKLKHSDQDAISGNHELRTQIAQYLQVVRGVKCTVDQVMICSGSQQAMYLTLRMLVNSGEPVLVENPGYKGTDGALLSVGAQKVPVNVDQHGFRLQNGLDAAPDARLVLLTPSRNFPMGYTLSLERRLELIAWAKQTGSWLIEDDYDSEFRFDGSPLTALQGLGGESCVIYTGTFSRIIHHSLRIGYLVLPEALVEPFAQAKRYLDGGLSQLPQAALAEFMASGHFASHVRRMRKLYQQRRVLLQQLIAQHLADILTPLGSDDSMHSVFLLPAGYDDQLICAAAQQQGVGIRPLSQYYDGTVGENGLVIGFAGYDQVEMLRGIEILTITLLKQPEH
uniref:Transcriptional regulator, GntR family domain / Aspartate aminotransferase (EC) n=1 Tax=uncultured Thiotrichaceae bacterium TaxID=298394 RepID=A0A6S6UJY4_9GAMM|nr:MAG: Transcriptional regulator, GntR family domain / Aspartate aminotransferase (EC [uncultured Thiotrichaceae bacterium]